MKKINISTRLGIYLLSAFCLSSANAASELKDIVDNVKIDGFAHLRYTANFGNDANIGGNTGKSWNPRLVLNVHSGAYEGFSFTAGLIYNKGSGSAGNGTDTKDNIWGGRGDSAYESANDVFGFGNLYAQYKNDAINTIFRGGQITMQTPINNKNFDRGLGALVQNNSINGINITLIGLDSWISDGLWLLNGGNIKGFGNDLFALGILGDKKELNNINFSLYGFHISKLIDYTIFASLGYTLEFTKTANLNFEIQVLNTSINKNPSFSVKSASIPSGNLDATNRGIYTAQISGKYESLNAKIGFIGSFGDGYGVSINNVGSINKGGKYWYDTSGSQYNGFGIFGQGGKKDSSIQIIYAAIGYKIEGFGMALDVANISGKNFYRAMYSGTNSNGFNGNKHAKFTELTPSLSYSFTKNANISAYYAMNFGDIKANRIRAEVKYTF